MAEEKKGARARKTRAKKKPWELSLRFKNLGVVGKRWPAFFRGRGGPNWAKTAGVFALKHLVTEKVVLVGSSADLAAAILRHVKRAATEHPSIAVESLSWSRGALAVCVLPISDPEEQEAAVRFLRKRFKVPAEGLIVGSAS